MRCQEKCGFRFHHIEADVPCELMGDVRTEYFTRLTKDEWLAFVNDDVAQCSFNLNFHMLKFWVQSY